MPQKNCSNAILGTEDSRKKGYKILLFLISPFISFIYSLFSIKTKSSKVIFFLFCLFFGLSFTIDANRSIDLDGSSYRTLFEYYARGQSSLFFGELRDYLSFDGIRSDFLVNIIAFVVSRATDNYHYFFLVIAGIFAFFQIKSINFLVSNRKFTYSLIPFILLFLFSWNTIFNINGMRFWTAAWIAVFSTLMIIISGQNRYFLLLLVTPFVHGSYVLYVSLLVLCLFLRKYERVWIVLFILSFIFSNLMIEVFQHAIDILPSFLGKKLSWYASDEAIATRANYTGSGFYWVDKLFKTFSRIHLNLLILFLFCYRNKISNENILKLFRFTLAYVTICNFLLCIPSVGARFINLSYPFIALVTLDLYKSSKALQIIMLILPFLWFVSIYQLLQNILIVTDLSFYFSNPLFLIFKHLLVP